MKAASRKSTNPRKRLIAKADEVFSLYVRMSHANEDGNCKCVTCPKVLPWRQIQCGHWVKRGHAATRWDIRNAYPQCPGDNLYKNGLQDEMALHIQRVHGPETLDELIRLKHTTRRWSAPELRELIEQLQEKVCQL
jgi:hypothetical protein